MLVRLGHDRGDLVDTLGVPDDVADQALAAADEDAMLDLAQRHEGWLGTASWWTSPPGTRRGDRRAHATREGRPVRRRRCRRAAIRSSGPPLGLQYAFIDDQEELRRVIEEGDFGAWRIFLHPEQRRYVDRRYNGPFRLSGGAGTGKTVVLVHRARALARRDTDARIVLTTFTTNLAEALGDNLTQLDPRVPQTKALDQPGVYVTGVDALAAAVLRSAGTGLRAAMRDVLGEERSAPLARTAGTDGVRRSSRPAHPCRTSSPTRRSLPPSTPTSCCPTRSTTRPPTFGSAGRAAEWPSTAPSAPPCGR